MSTSKFVRQGFPLWRLAALLTACTTTTVDEFRQGGPADIAGSDVCDANSHGIQYAQRGAKLEHVLVM